MNTNNDRHYTQVVARGDKYQIVTIEDEQPKWWNARTRTFGSFYERTLYRTSRLAQNAADCIFSSLDLHEPFHGNIRDTDA